MELEFIKIKTLSVNNKHNIKQLKKNINFYIMKTKTLIIALTLSLGLFTACTDKKKTKEKVETEVISE